MAFRIDYDFKKEWSCGGCNASKKINSRDKKKINIILDGFKNKWSSLMMKIVCILD